MLSRKSSGEASPSVQQGESQSEAVELRRMLARSQEQAAKLERMLGEKDREITELRLAAGKGDSIMTRRVLHLKSPLACMQRGLDHLVPFRRLYRKTT